MIRRQVILSVLGAAVCAPWIATAASESLDDPAQVYAALRKRPDAALSIGGGKIDVVFANGAPGVDRTRVIAWIQKSAVAVATYFGRFPAHHLGLLVIGEDGDRVGHGTTYGFDGAAIRIHVGRSAGDDAFGRDWVLVHEMVHLALPVVPRESLWLQEGNATYVEPISRAQAGQLDAASVWRWSLRGMPKGEPGPDDAGLDHTPTWGRTYWGGATFWLLADVAIYQHTAGRHSLQEALRAINRASGGNTARWASDQIMAAGDAATGTDVLRTLYAQQKDAPVHNDLDGIFQSLGVAEVDGLIVFDDNAPLSSLRRRLTQRSTWRAA